MTVLPPNIEPDDEIALTWERDEDGIRITAVLGEASIAIDASYDGVELVPWLVAALPSILEAAWEGLGANMEEQ